MIAPPYFKPADNKLSATLEAIQAAEEKENLPPVASLGDSLLTPQRLPLASHKSPARKRRRLLEAMVEPTTTTQLVIAGGQMQRSLAEASNMKTLAENLEKLVLPDQLAVVLSNRKLQHVLSLSYKRSDLLRIQHWLRMRLSQSFMSPARSSGARLAQSALLSSIVTMTSFFQELPPVVEEWLVGHLPTWDGESHQGAILELVSWIRPTSFSRLNGEILTPLQRHLVTVEARSVAILDAYTLLLERWAGLDWSRVSGAHEGKGKAKSVFVFHELERGLDYHRTIQLFVRHVESAGMLSLQVNEGSAQISSSILSFFETAGRLCTAFELPYTVLPNPGLFYATLLSRCAAVVSRGAGLLVQFKREFELLKNMDPIEANLSFENGLDQIPLFNEYVMDYSNVLWRQRAFEETQKTILFKVNEEAVGVLKQGHTVKQALSITHSTPWSAECFRYLQGLRDRIQPEQHIILTPSMVKDKMRVDYLDYLRQQGYLGLHEFLYTFIGSLVERAKTKKPT